MNNDKKRYLGQFYTKETSWLKPQIANFIKSSNCSVIYDPFAGCGDIFHSMEKLGYSNFVGLDIDKNLGWKYNDSLIKIPHIKDAIIITNPPYLSNYSAARKKVYDKVEKYFKMSDYCDLYLIALEKMLEAQTFVVAILPETFINSNFKHKDKLSNLTVLEENPFLDTDSPVLVACFDGVKKSFKDILIYKNNVLINNLEYFENLRLLPSKKIDMIFNDINGWLAVRCVDSTNPNDVLRFDFKDNIKYDWDKNIKVSSRLLTLISVDVPDNRKNEFIIECNKILNELREKTSDIILSPFKGNAKNGKRRRRLDFKTCRAIIEMAYSNIVNKISGGKNE